MSALHRNAIAYAGLLDTFARHLKLWFSVDFLAYFLGRNCNYWRFAGRNASGKQPFSGTVSGAFLHVREFAWSGTRFSMSSPQSPALQEAFNTFDEDGSGFVDLQELIRCLRCQPALYYLKV